MTYWLELQRGQPAIAVTVKLGMTVRTQLRLCQATRAQVSSGITRLPQRQMQSDQQSATGVLQWKKLAP
jgi:hypothetical protein